MLTGDRCVYLSISDVPIIIIPYKGDNNFIMKNNSVKLRKKRGKTFENIFRKLVSYSL